MLIRVKRWKSIILSPGISIIVAILGAIAIFLSEANALYLLPIDIFIGGLLVYEIKARTLFKGPNYPILAIFMLLQSLTGSSLIGCLLALTALLGLILAINSYENTDNTRALYSFFLICGTTALWQRSFLLLIPVLIAAFITLKAMSFRGVVAIILSLLTPLILCLSAGFISPERIIEEYTQSWTPIFLTNNLEALRPTLYSAIAIIVVCLAMFLTAYGYPAKQRAANMSILVLSLATILPPIFVTEVADQFLPLMNVCIAYQIAHFAATRSFGWIAIILFWLLIPALFLL